MSIPSFPSSSPAGRPLKYLLWAILLGTLAGPLLQKAGIPIQYYLGLSEPALTSVFVWTVLTYPFTYPATGTLDLILHLGVDLFLLWIFGSFVMERMGPKRFFLLFFGAILCAGLAAAAGLFLFHRSFFGGPSPALLALFTSWFIFHSEEENHFLKPIWVFLLLVVGNLFLDALARQWVSLIADMSGTLFGYLFCLISEKMRSPFPFLRPFEKSVLRAVERVHAAKKPASPKIFDFKTGEPVLDDEQFMDAMLARISLYGEETLTADEKKRMQKISERKAAKKR